jgi:hypothetical protein
MHNRSRLQPSFVGFGMGMGGGGEIIAYYCKHGDTRWNVLNGLHLLVAATFIHFDGAFGWT